MQCKTRIGAVFRQRLYNLILCLAVLSQVLEKITRYRGCALQSIAANFSFFTKFSSIRRIGSCCFRFTGSKFSKTYLKNFNSKILVDAARLAARCESCMDAARLAARCYKFSKIFSKTIDSAGIKLPAAGILQVTVCKEVLEDAGFKGK